MSKFNTKSGSEDRGRSRSRGDKKPARSAAGAGDEKKNYKAKRSFTKNKSFRETKEGKPGEKPRRPFTGPENRKPFKKDFGGERASGYGDKPKRSYSGQDDKKTFDKDFSKDKYGDKPRKSSRDLDDRKPFKKEGSGFKDDKFERPRRSGDDKGVRKPFRDSEDRPKRSFDDTSDKKSYKKVIKSKDDKFAGFKKASSGNYDKYLASAKPGASSEKPGKRRLTKPRKTEDGEFTKRVKYDELKKERLSRLRLPEKNLEKSALKNLRPLQNKQAQMA